jgi:hypothetical protein
MKRYNSRTMSRPELVQRLFSSKEFLFLFYTLGMGTFIQLLPPNNRPFSWSLVLIIGVPSGFVMTFMTLRQIKKNNELTGLTEATEQRELYKAVKTGILPDDPKIRKALGHYLPRLIEANLQANQKGSSLVFVIILALLMALSGSAYLAIVAAFLVLMLMLSRLSVRKANVRLHDLYVKLQASHEGTKLAPSPLDTAAPSPFMTRRQWVVAGIIIGLYVALGLLTRLAPPPPDETPQPQSAESSTHSELNSIPGPGGVLLKGIPIDPTGSIVGDGDTDSSESPDAGYTNGLQDSPTEFPTPTPEQAADGEY